MPETLLNKGKIKKSLFKRLFIMSTGNEKDAFPAQAPKLRQRKKPRTRIACRGSRLSPGTKKDAKLLSRASSFKQRRRPGARIGSRPCL